MCVNLKAREKKKKKRKEKTFMEEVKNISAKATLHRPTLLQLYPGQIRSTARCKKIVAAQAFDDDQTLSISWIAIAKANMK